MKPRYIVEAEALLGEKEIAGRLTNPKIKELFADAGVPSVVSDEVPWCAAFVGATLARANQPNTGTLLARDYRSPEFLAKCIDHGKKPVLYSIGVMRRGDSGWEGHVGYVMDFDAKTVTLLGGNQSDSVKLQTFPREKFIGFATPKDTEADMTTAQLVTSSRRMAVQSWIQRIYLVLSAGLAAVWNYANDIVNLAKDHTGVILLGVVGFGWLSVALLKSMSVREYREGRYLPSKQWE